MESVPRHGAFLLSLFNQMVRPSTEKPELRLLRDVIEVTQTRSLYTVFVWEKKVGLSFRLLNPGKLLASDVTKVG